MPDHALTAGGGQGAERLPACSKDPGSCRLQLIPAVSVAACYQRTPAANYWPITRRSTVRSVPNLTQAWTRAEASKPLGWTLQGGVLGPREVDPHVRSEKWVAWARGPIGERVEGEGEIPEQALVDPATKLKAIRPNPNG
jgi:hypothetical protein